MDARHDRVIVVRAAEQTAGPQTLGMRREEAFATDDLWAGLVTTEPGTAWPPREPIPIQRWTIRRLTLVGALVGGVVLAVWVTWINLGSTGLR